MKELGFQGFVALLLLMAVMMALIYGFKYEQDVRSGKANNDHDRWWGMMLGSSIRLKTNR